MTCLLSHFIHLRPQVGVVPTGPGIGYFNLNAQVSTHTLTWTSSGQTLVAPTNTTIANGSIVLGSIAGTEIIVSGAFATTGQMTIAGPARTINTAIATQTGGGTVTLLDPPTIGINGVANFIVDSGAQLNLGNDWSKKHGWFFGAGGNGVMTNSGVLEVRPADLLATDPLSSDPQNGGNTTTSSTAILRYVGNPSGGTTYIRDRSPIATGAADTAVVELSNNFYLGTNGFTGSGTVKVPAGSAISSSDLPVATVAAGNWSSTVSYEIAGDGVDRAGLPKGAFILRNRQTPNAAKITLTANARISGDISSTAAWFNGPFVSTVDKILSVGSPAVGARFGDAATAIVRLNASSPNLRGPVHVEHGTLELNVANSAAQAARIKLTGNAILRPNVTNSVKSIQSSDSTTTVNLAANLTLSAQEAPVVSSNITGTGILSIAGGTLLTDRATLTLTGTINVTTGKFGTTQAVTNITGIFSPGASGSGTLVLTNVGGVPSKIVATTINAPTAGWKVDIPAGLSAGTHTILTRTNGTVVAPVVGVNDSGLTASFAWVGGDLRLTLS